MSARRFDAAETDLAEAIRHFESQRSRLTARQYRASFFQDGWLAFAQMSRVQHALDRTPSAALDYAERGRARTLLEAASNAEAAQPLDAEAVQRKLPDDTAALFFVTLDDRLLAWVIRPNDISLVERSISASRLRFMVSRVSWLLRQPAADDGRLIAELSELHAEIIEPLMLGNGKLRRIVVVPDGPLHALPFAALVNSRTGRYLIQDYDVMTAPSLSMMVGPAINERPAPWTVGKLRAIVVGNPSRETGTDESWLPSLPFSEDEARRVAAVYQRSTLLVAAAATKSELLKHLEDYDILHYAGHALVNEQTPSLSRLLLSPDKQSQDDGSLFVSELSSVRLQRTKLVVLAACSTGTGLISNGEGVQSLARPFLEAGASWVIATFWDIQDKTAADLFLAVHRDIAAGDWPGSALSRVQRQFIESPEPSRRRPSQWAWAALIGSIRQPSTH